MESTPADSDFVDENQSLQVIREMIRVSQNKLKGDVIVMIVWGYAMSLMHLGKYITEVWFLPHRIIYFLKFVDPVLPLLAFIFTVYYIIRERKKVTTYIGISLRYVWVAWFISIVFTNLILFNVLKKIDFTVQHPLFMVLIAFAIVVTGVILRYRLIIAGGAVFGVLAYICSYLPLNEQMLLHGIAWIIAIVIPGHILYFKRDKQHVQGS